MQSYNPLSHAFASQDQVVPLCRSASPSVVSFYRNFTLPQYAVQCCARRFIVLVAGRRGGKTTVALYKMLCQAASKPRQRCYFIAPTLKQAQETAWRMLLGLSPPPSTRKEYVKSVELEGVCF